MFDDYGERFDKIIDEIAIAILFEAKTMLTVRIYDEHKNADGKSLGKYSTKPALIGAKSFRNKTQADKFFNSDEAFTDDTQGFRTLSNKKKAYLLPGGYKKLRSIQGMPSEEINLQYSSDLKKNGIVTVISGGKYQLVFRTDYYTKIARGFEIKHNQKVYSLSEEEQKTLFDLAQKLLNEKTNEHFR